MERVRNGSFFLTGNQLHWLAGILEGEGTFSLTRHPLERLTPKVYVNMTDIDIIQRVAQLIGAVVRQCRKESENLQAQFATQVGGGSAVALMAQLRPLMGERRREQIDRAVAAHQLVVPYGHRFYYLLEDERPEPERHWLAGYLEGEGCFEQSKFLVKGKTYTYPRFEITTTDHDVILRVQELWRTRYDIPANILSRQPRYPGSKMTYRLIINNAPAITIMRDLYDLLGERRQAKIRAILGGAPGGEASVTGGMLRERRAVYRWW